MCGRWRCAWLTVTSAGSRSSRRPRWSSTTPERPSCVTGVSRSAALHGRQPLSGAGRGLARWARSAPCLPGDPEEHAVNDPALTMADRELTLKVVEGTEPPSGLDVSQLLT